MDTRMLAEWEDCEAILLALPHSETDWNYILDEAIEQYRILIKAFTDNGEKCVVLVKDSETARQQLKGLDLENVVLIELPTNDTWTRDYGPISVIYEDCFRVLDFGFNGWGLKFAADKDNLVNLSLWNKSVITPQSYKNVHYFILEGGALETDGKGTLLTTSKCMFSENRNGGLGKECLSEMLGSFLGVYHILWLDYGGLEGDDTDSHIDTLCRMAPGNTIVFTGCRNMDDSHFEELLRMRAQLSIFRNAEGERYNLLELPLPDPIFDEDGKRLPATYANYLVTERNIFMPVYNQHANDMLACNIVKVAFPDHNVVPVECLTLIRQHGSLHCSTMQLPHGLLNPVIFEK